MSEGSLSVGAIAGIAVGAVVVLALGVYIVLKNTKKSRPQEEPTPSKSEAMTKMESTENLVGRNTRYFAQQRSHSPASSYVLAPSTAVVNWGDSKNIHSASSSILDGRSRNGSVSLFPYPQPAFIKTSPLRLNPSNASIRSGRVSPSSSVGGTYMPPLPSPRHFTSSQASSGWVSPLDVHFSRPSTPKSSAVSVSSLQFPFPEVRKSGLLVPTPAGSVLAVNPGGVSTVSSAPTLPQLMPEHVKEIVSASDSFSESANNADPVPAPELPPLEKSSISGFNFNFIDNEPEPQKPSSRGARGSTRSIFPATSDAERPISRRSAKSFDLNPPPISQAGPTSPGIDPKLFGERAILRHSIVSKRSVSIYDPSEAPPTPLPESAFPQTQIQAQPQNHSKSQSQSQSQPQPQSQSHTRTQRHSASSVYSSYSARTRSISPHSHQRSRSTSSKRTSKPLARSTDSIRHSRKQSLGAQEHRRSRDRDQMYFDPSTHHRNRSGSVQGRAVNFDRPRDSPFFNPFANSARSSVSVLMTTGVGTNVPEIPPRALARKYTGDSLTVGGAGGGLGIAMRDEDRLSVATARSRGRSASEASVNSGFGDFYDAYYRSSILAQRASGMGSQTSSVDKGDQPLAVQGVNGLGGVGADLGGYGGGPDRLPRGRPPPLKLGGSNLGEVMEVASPLSTPAQVGGERFPMRF